MEQSNRSLVLIETSGKQRFLGKSLPVNDLLAEEELLRRSELIASLPDQLITELNDCLSIDQFSELVIIQKTSGKLMIDCPNQAVADEVVWICTLFPLRYVPSLQVMGVSLAYRNDDDFPNLIQRLHELARQNRVNLYPSEFRTHGVHHGTDYEGFITINEVEEGKTSSLLPSELVGASGYSLLHCDGNGVGNLFRNFHNLRLNKNKSYLEDLSLYTTELNSVVKEATRRAEDGTSMAQTSSGIREIVTLISAGDDVTVRLMPNSSVNVISTYFRNFYLLTGSSEVLNHEAALTAAGALVTYDSRIAFRTITEQSERITKQVKQLISQISNVIGKQKVSGLGLSFVSNGNGITEITEEPHFYFRIEDENLGDIDNDLGPNIDVLSKTIDRLRRFQENDYDAPQDQISHRQKLRVLLELFRDGSIGDQHKVNLVDFIEMGLFEREEIEYIWPFSTNLFFDSVSGIVCPMYDALLLLFWQDLCRDS